MKFMHVLQAAALIFKKFNFSLGQYGSPRWWNLCGKFSWALFLFTSDTFMKYIGIFLIMLL
jgi:hypothetical protein